MTHAKWANVRWPSRTVATLERRNTSEIRIALARFHSNVSIDIREWSREAAEGKSWYPERKGVSIRRSEIPALIEALQRAEAEFDDFAASAYVDRTAA